MTPEEITKAANDLKTAGYIVRTVDEEAVLMRNFKEFEVEKEIGARIGKVHQQYDDDLFELTGRRKESGQKTYDFNKQVIKELKESAGLRPSLEQKIKDLEKKIADGSSDEATKAKLLQYEKEVEQLKATYKTEKEKWEADKVGFNEELQRFKIESVLDQAISGMTFKDDALIPRAAKEALIREKKSAVLKMARLRENKLVFVTDKDEVIRNKDKALEPMTAQEMFASELKDIIEIQKQTKGTGGKPDPKSGGKGSSNITIPPTVKTQVQLSNYLMEAGLVRGSKEYQEAFNANGKELPLN